MKETRKNRKEPMFLLEMPHSLRHLIMKRGQMLRGSRTRTLSCISQGGSAAWLEAKLIPHPGESTDEDWDKAHELAATFRHQLHAEVYVEPAQHEGRFREITAPAEFPADDASDPLSALGVAENFGFGTGVAGGVGNLFGGDRSMGRNFGPNNPNGFGLPNNNFPGIPHIPDPMKDLLPPQMSKMLAGLPGKSLTKSKRVDLTFPAIKELPGWSKLSAVKQKMYEVEAAQLLRERPILAEDNMQVVGNIDLPDPFAKQRALASVSVHPRISKSLKRFLLEGFEVMTVKQKVQEIF